MSSNQPPIETTTVEPPVADPREAFLEAARDERHDEVRAMLANKKIEIESRYIDHALHVASTVGAVEIVRILLGTGGVNINSVRRCREKFDLDEEVHASWEPCISCRGSSIQAAASGGHTEIVSILLKAGDNIEGNSGYYTPLRAAASGGHTEIVSILLKAGANIEGGPRYSTPLRAAAEGGHTEIVSILLKAGANIEGNSVYGTPLREAASGGHTEIVSILLKAGANIEGNSGYYTPLRAAASGGHTEIVSILLKAGANIEGNSGYYTPLRAAASGGHTEIVSILLKAGANIEGNSVYGTPLREAASGGHTEIVSILLKAGANIEGGPRYSTPLREAASGGHTEIVSILLKAGANIEGGPRYSTPLREAASGGHTEIVSILQKAGASIEGNNWGTPLRAAAEGGHTEIVSILLKAGANIEGNSVYGTPLREAASGGHTEIVSILLKAGANIEGGPRYSTPLREAASGGHTEIVSILQKAGASIEGNNWGTPLRAAAEGGHTEIVSILLKAGANIEGNSVYGTPLWEAASGGHTEIVSILLKAGANIEGGPRYSTPLREAASGGHTEIVSILLKADANIEAQHRGKSALQAAAENGHDEVVSAILDANVDVNAQDASGRTCLTWGISHVKVVKLLLDRGADIHLKALDGATPLHCAVKDGHIESVAVLLKAGSNIESMDYSDRKPLDIALQNHESSPESAKLVELLLEHGCDIGRREIDSWRAFVKAKETEVIVITETPSSVSDSKAISEGGGDSRNKVHGKVNIKFGLIQESQGPPHLHVSPNLSTLITRRLYYTSKAKIMFPALNIKGKLASKFSRSDTPPTSAVIEWQWFFLNEFGEPTGYGLSNVGGLATTTDKQALLGCWVSFQFLVQVPQPERTPSTSGSAFHTKTQSSEISWIMRKQCIDPTIQPDPANSLQTKSSPIFRSEDFRSTLDIGWIPDSGLDFFTLFVIDLHKKWRLILECADSHLSMNREILLLKKGKTIDFIDNLLLDAQQWSNFRVLLQTHVRKSKDLVQDFKERRYLCDEVSLQDKEGVQNKRKRSARDLAIGKLSKAIQRMENEVEGEIKKLDQKTKEMIELEFNLVSIYEARTSKTMGMSMKRLSWITFIFLPLMFVASLFGMNVDLISGGPRWWWVIVLGVLVFVLVISVWALLKLIRVDEWPEDDDGATIAIKLKTLSGNLGRGLRKSAKRGRSDDLESGPMGASGAFQFKPPTRQWTKLKDL